MPIGQKLKALRNKRNITVREVEQASHRIADAKADKRFCISNGWLAQLENGQSEPSIYKLFSLSAIYRVEFLELAGLYGVNLNEISKYERVANPHSTQILPLEDASCVSKSDSVNASLVPPKAITNLIPNTKSFSSLSSGREPTETSLIYGYIGLNDFTMFPLIRPGAIVRIDTAQTRVQPTSWRNEYERPIFFIELRDAFACGWCELQGNHLLIIPHHLSPGAIRRLAYPKEAEIVGRITGFDTGCVEQQPNYAQHPKGQRFNRAAR